MNAIVENAVGGLLASEAHGVIGIVLSRINAEIKLAWGFKKELEELQVQLSTVMEMLQGACSQAITNSLMDDWLKKIKDAAYDADDLLDEWSYEALEARIRIRKRDKFIRGVSKPFYSLRMGHKERDLTKLISNIYSDGYKLGIKPIGVAAGEIYNNQHSHQIEDQETRLCNMRHYVDEKLLIGRDEELAHAPC
uniref:Disease resistance N-terminal domain-containing protein n=1 Tax=Chenopodium quinoa TaxID=63459 RepID=A0A803N0S7_CHEQI